MTTRMRLVGWNVQPVVMADDGENLTPVNVGAQTIPAAQWEAFKTGGDAEALERLRAQIETASNQTAGTTPKPVHEGITDGARDVERTMRLELERRQAAADANQTPK